MPASDTEEHVWDYAISLKLVIERPAAEVWQYFLGAKKNDWTASSYTTVAGTAGELGEIYTHEHAIHGMRTFYEAIRVVRHEEIVLKIIAEDQAGTRRLIGYDFILLEEETGSTTLRFQQAVAFPFEDPTKDLEEATSTQNERITWLFHNLKRLAEDGRPAGDEA